MDITNSLIVNTVTTGFEAKINSYIASSLNTIKDSAKAFVDKFDGQPVKIALVDYSKSAKVVGSTFYDMSVASEVGQIKGKIDELTPSGEGKINLGDALRQAYYFFDGPKSNSNATKYVVSFVTGKSNTWTSNTSSFDEYKTLNGNSDYTPKDGEGASGKSGEGYAKTIGQMIKANKSINTYFVNFSAEESTSNSLEQIAVAAGAGEVTGGQHYYKVEQGLSQIFDKVSKVVIGEAKLKSAEFSQILPAGVKVVSVPTNLTVTTITDEVTKLERQKIAGSLKLNALSKNDTGYTLSEEDFKIKVKFVKTGKITFDGADSKVTFNIEYIDTKGDTKTDTKQVSFNSFTTQVVKRIDIG